MDGCCDHRAIPTDEELHRHHAEKLAQTDALLFGRVTYEMMEWQSAPDDQTLGVVDFSIFPHLDHEMMPENTLAHAERWAADIAGPAYAIDEQTAIKVVDGAVEVVSECHWKLLVR